MQKMNSAGYSLTLPTEWDRTSRWLNIFSLTAIVCLSHGIFELTFDKKAGIPFFREAVVIALLLISAYLLLKYPTFLRYKLSSAIIGYVVAFFALSAIFSWYWFAQPLKFSLLEERRLLGMLWFFPMLWFMLRAQPTVDEINRAYLLSGAVLAAYSLLYYIGIIPDNKMSSDIYIEQYFYADDDPRNLTRYVLGSSLLMVVIPLTVLLALRNLRVGRSNLWNGLVFLLCSFTLLMIDQSRSTLIGILLVVFFVLLGQTRAHWRPALFAAGALGLLSIGAVLVCVQNEKVQWLLNSLLTGQGVRNQTSLIIWQVLKDTWFWGHGALSIQYNRGFLDVYNENFWLNDVGKLGLLYRFGFLTLLFAAFYMYALNFLRAAKKRFPDFSILQVLVPVYFITLIAPWGSVIALLPAELGIALGLVINYENRASR